MRIIESNGMVQNESGNEQSADSNLFPKAAIEILQNTKWSPDAKRSYELMSGGFHWSDEGLPNVTMICFEVESWAVRYVMGYRASLIRGKPREELKGPWDQLLTECPNWPGFRAERCHPSLMEELDQESLQLEKELDELEEKLKQKSADEQG